MPISTVHQSAQLGFETATRPRPPAIGMLSTYPPTQCGLATFSAALIQHLQLGSGSLGVVQVVDEPEPRSGPDVVAQLVNGSADSAGAAVRRLNGFDVVVVQHEYGIYGGPDGVDVLAIVDALTVPAIIVLHTVLQDPTAAQRHILLRLLAAADVVVTMTHTAKRRLIASYGADPTQIVVIPHGAVDHGHAVPRIARTADRPLVLTWGLIGPGKGIEWAIDAMVGLRDLQPRYLVMGRSHPKVAHRDGEAYRDGLVAARAVRRGPGHRRVRRPLPRRGELAELVQRADVVLLPYDSREQVTSGVLIEAVAAGRPVVSTAFPHAIELLADGTGLVVPQRDPAALEAALRRVLSEPDLAAGPGRAGGAEGSRAAVARGGRPLPEDRGTRRRGGHGRGLVTGAVQPRSRDRRSRPRGTRTCARSPTQAGCTSTPRDASPRREHGYCLDDVARALVVVCREQSLGELDDLREQYLTFVLAAQEPDGRFHNRRRSDSALVGHGVGRGLLGSRAVGSRHRRRAGAAPARAGARRVRPWRSAALPAPARHGLRRAGRRGGARGAARPRRGASADRRRRSTWSAGLRSTRRGHGRSRGSATPTRRCPRRCSRRAPHWIRPHSSRTASACWAGCSTGRSRDGHLSVVPAGGRGPGETVPAFDQQPIEVAALADACAAGPSDRRAAAVGRGGRARRGVVPRRTTTPARRCTIPCHGGGFDGLERVGRNENQGAESTLALLSTLQQARSMALHGAEGRSS